MIHPTDTEITYFERIEGWNEKCEKIMNHIAKENDEAIKGLDLREFVKARIRNLIKEQHWSDIEVGELAKDFINDSNLGATFLEYLERKSNETVGH
jgi:hypothetical protein